MAATDKELREAIAREDEVVAQIGDVPSGVRRVPRPGRHYDERGNVRPSDSRHPDGEEGESNRVGTASRPADEHLPAEVLAQEKIASAALQTAHSTIAADFDPAEHTVEEVNDYLATASDAETVRVIEDESAGKARVGIVNGPYGDEPADADG